MVKFNVRSRLFLSHILVMCVGLASFIVISKVYSPRLFILQLERLEETRFFNTRSVRTYLVRGFEATWNRSTFWSVIVGATAAGVLSYWVAKRITQPLMQMKQITQNFAAGNLQQRMARHEIPELDQLSTSFNSMADSIEDIEQRRRELISDMSHELRTPLTVVRGYLEELADGQIQATPDIYQQLIRETRRLERLVNDLQELSKAEAGHLPIHLKPTHLQPLLQSLLEKFKDQLLEYGPILSLNCPMNLPPVLADLDRTEQILVNLIGNAICYTPTGSITITAWVNSPWVWVAIVDTGIGISETDLPHIFERFWRAERSRSRHSGGTGIGLAITQRLVELQGGRIEVKSQVNQGSTFQFCLPLL